MSRVSTLGALVSNDSGLSDLEIAKLLMQDYLTARQEIHLHMQHFKTQERYASIMIS